MLPKPSHLGPGYAAQFTDPSVIAAYHHRPPYPVEIFTVLDRLIVDTTRTVLDIGSGTGEIARHLAGRVEHIDAVDPSPGMLAKARQMPGGDNPRISWVCSRAEDDHLSGPYALVTAGASLHWMEWDVVLPRIRNVLSSNAVLAIIDNHEMPVPWRTELRQLIAQFSTNREFQTYDLVAELEQRALFTQIGEHRTAPITFVQSMSDYIESFHARNGFSRDRMGSGAADAFDDALADMVVPHASNGLVTLHLVAELRWGVPGNGSQTLTTPRAGS